MRRRIVALVAACLPTRSKARRQVNLVLLATGFYSLLTISVVATPRPDGKSPFHCRTVSQTSRDEAVVACEPDCRYPPKFTTAAEYIRSGMAPEEAHRRAQAEIEYWRKLCPVSPQKPN